MRKKLKFVFLIWTQKKAASKIGKEETKLQQKKNQVPFNHKRKNQLNFRSKNCSDFLELFMFQVGMIAIIFFFNFQVCNHNLKEERKRRVCSIARQLDCKQILLDEDAHLRGQQVETR